MTRMRSCKARRSLLMMWIVQARASEARQRRKGDHARRGKAFDVDRTRRGEAFDEDRTR